MTSKSLLFFILQDIHKFDAVESLQFPTIYPGFKTVFLPFHAPLWTGLPMW